MSQGRALAQISCGRCQSKKIRCNRVTPRCEKCELAGVECVYSARKQRSKKQGKLTEDARIETSERALLFEVLDRLKRLEQHCGLEDTANTQDNGDDSMSISSGESAKSQDTTLATSPDSPPTHLPAVINTIVHRIKDEGSRSMLLSNVFCHLRQVESCFFENERCIRATTSAMAEIDFMQSSIPPTEPPRDPIVPKEMAKKCIENYYTCYQFEGFKIPLEKSFLCSIPDLIDIPHVNLDHTSQIIYYTTLLQGMVLDPAPYAGRGAIIRNLYLKCVSLSDDWLKNIKESPADLFAAFLMISMALEGCNLDLSWKCFSQACRISKALGYHSVDETPETPPTITTQDQDQSARQAEVDKNRKRFEFWHILRTDSLFRMSFGKPNLIPAGSWKVNFPDPSITGVDDDSSRFIQIHFLACMRLALIVMRYLDWLDCGMPGDIDPVQYDHTVDSFINEVQSVLSDWDTEGLLKRATNHVDIWFCVDILFSSYKMLIVLYQSKKCNRSHILPREAVSMARKSLTTFQGLLAASLNSFWGISLILLHQLIPYFILCLDIIGNPEPEELDADLVLIMWISDYVEMVVEDRFELKPILIILKAMATACQQTKMDRLSRPVIMGAAIG